MNFEKDIPDYAMMPAKEKDAQSVKPITKEALYTPVDTTNILKGPKLTLTIEEDILVPDTKPDLKEILIMEGSCHLATREVSPASKKEEYINLSGHLRLQTLYLPEKADKLCPIISMETTIPFKEQLQTSSTSSIFFHCEIENIEYSVVNERKYRVKASLVISSKEYCHQTINLFDGLLGDQLEVLKEKMEFSHLTQRKKDILSIKEYISSFGDWQPGAIMLHSLSVVENYKQIAQDKVVVNGFICVNALCCDKSPIDDVSLADNFKQVQEKVEFTQFIPLSHGTSQMDCFLSFDCSQLKLKLAQHEDGQNVLCLEGDLLTYVELYRKVEKDVIVDAYHKEKSFVCDFAQTGATAIIGNSVSEASIREIFVPKSSFDIEDIIFSTGEIKTVKNSFEQGKVLCTGTICAKMICVLADESHTVEALTEEIPFRLATTIPGLSEEDDVHFSVCLKDLWSEKINGKQLEFNASIMVKCEAAKEVSFKLLTSPAFETSASSSQYSPMVIYCCKENDSLWQIAKKFKTSIETIMSVNHLENDNLTSGKKLLIIK